MKKIVIQMGLCLFLASCGETVEVQQPELPAGAPVDVTAELSVSVSPMTTLCTSATRSHEGDSHSKALQVDYLSGSATRADVAMSVAEKEIKSAYVVQFDGTSAGSTAVWVSTDVSALVKSGSPVNCSFKLTSGVKSRVYVIANPAKVPTLDMTLQSFETVSYTVSSTLPSTGLPMVESQDVALGGTFTLFQLKSPLARLTFTTNTGTLSLKGIPSAYSLAPATAGDGAVRPSGITYTATAALSSGTTYYIPANLSGRVDLSNPILRCSAFAPSNSMYVVISANSTTYNIYLGDSSAGDFNVVGNCAYAISASVNGTDGGDMRVGTAPTITALDGSGTANCYIATSANTWYSFNGTVMGNGKSTPLPADLNTSKSVAAAITPSALAPASAGVLWETWNTTSTPTKGSVVRGAYVAKGRMLFRTGSSQGNAVIAAYASGSSTPCWSWHIWRTNTTPASQPLAAISGFATAGELVIMDRNLGALSATAQNDLSTGLHYQWGRKDPFPAYAGLTSPNNVVMATQPAGIPIIPSSTAQYTVTQSIQQPTTFLKYAGDWCITRNDNLWGTPLTVISGGFTTNKGSKTIYDPCPPGWRIPPSYTFINASTSNGGTFNWGYSFGSGFLSSGSSWFPASGFRDCGNGALYYIGSNGDYWMATPYMGTPTYGSKLSFNGVSVSPTSNIYRASGYGCRCAKE